MYKDIISIYKASIKETMDLLPILAPPPTPTHQKAKYTILLQYSKSIKSISYILLFQTDQFRDTNVNKLQDY
jgi:hypothetical protein